MPRDCVIVLDFGSQYTQLIARRIRESGVYCEIHPFTLSLETLLQKNPRALIFSGGPSSVYGENAPRISEKIFDLPIPILGICYGAQLMAHMLGGRVERAHEGEYGPAKVQIEQPVGPFQRFQSTETIDVWMSHGDRISVLPSLFERFGESDNAPYCAIRHKTKPIYGLQFHPEVSHTPRGKDILESFLFDVAGLSKSWSMQNFVNEAVEKVRAQVGPNDHAIVGLSGGVDSSVAAVLCQHAVGDRLVCIFVDNGLLRQNEARIVMDMFQRNLHLNVIHVNAHDAFLSALHNVTDPETKRKTIGRVFIDVFEAEAKKVNNAQFLVQGTLYPDVIESVSVKGPSAVIKSHHNVGGLPERMHLKLIEPLRDLFKDEVRTLGEVLGIPREVLYRHPFPGPGLAVRCLGPLTDERLNALRNADAIFEEEIRNAGLYESIWQSFCVLLPVRTVGVMGDERTYSEVVALRSVQSTDGMTADWSRLPYDVLARTSSRIINEVRGVNRVVLDISSKPPSTIEWE